jgi:hypothetical protein
MKDIEEAALQAGEIKSLVHEKPLSEGGSPENLVSLNRT